MLSIFFFCGAVCVCVFETVTLAIIHSGFKFEMLLPQLLGCCVYRYLQLCLDLFYLLKVLY